MPRLPTLLCLLLIAWLASCAEQDEKPEIVWFFACSDYCPKPAQSYMIRVYKDVTDREECRRLGGVHGFVMGWGTQYYCAVADSDSEDRESKKTTRVD